MSRTTIVLASSVLLAAALHARAQTPPQHGGIGNDVPTTGGVEVGTTSIPNTGPGDTVPGGSSGGSSGGPAPVGPDQPGPSAGGTPTGPATGGPATAGPNGPIPRPIPIPPSTPTLGVDLTAWETWWSYNREFYLDVDAATRAARTFQGDVIAHTGSGLNPLVADPALIQEIVVPALLAILAEESNPDLVGAALIAIARLEAPRVTREASTGASAAPAWDDRLDERLASFVAHTQLSVAESATIALGLRARAANATRLAGLLADDAHGRTLAGRAAVTTRLRALAAYALGLVAERSDNEDLGRYVVHELGRALERSTETDREIQVACVEALGLARIGVAHIPLHQALGETPGSSREALVARLVRVLGAEDAPAIVRAHASVAIARLCEGVDEDVRNVALAAVLARATKTDEKLEVRVGAVLALGRLSKPIDVPADRETRRALQELVHDPDRTLRGPALIAAAEIGAAARTDEERAGAVELQKVVLGELARGRSGAPGWAALALGILGQRSALVPSAEGNRALRAALESSGTTSDLSATGLALGLRQDRSAYELLLGRVSREGEDRSRAAHALGLGLLGRPEAVGALRGVIERALYRPLVLRDAAIALALLLDKDVAPWLARVFQETRSLAAQSALSDALGYVGDARQLSELVRLARSKIATPATKALAVRAIGRIADARALPWNAGYLRDANYFAPTETFTNPGGGGILDQR